MVHIKVLNNITGKILIPKYGWIESLNWSKKVFPTTSRYILQINAKEGVMQSYINRTESQIYREAKTLFDMMGPSKNEVFFKIDIIDHKGTQMN